MASQALVAADDAKRPSARFIPWWDHRLIFQCEYDSPNNSCQRCTERNLDCGEKLPTPKKLAAMRDSARDSDDTSPSWSSPSDYPIRTESADCALLPPLRLENLAPLKDGALCQLWNNLTI